MKPLLPTDAWRHKQYSRLLGARDQIVIYCRDCRSDDSLIITRHGDNLITLFCEHCGPERDQPRRYLYDPKAPRAPSPPPDFTPHDEPPAPLYDRLLLDDPLRENPRFLEMCNDYRKRTGLLRGRK